MEKETVQIITSIATPFIAFVAIAYARMQARTNEMRRKQELFDLRYNFYQRVRKAYIAQGLGHGDVDIFVFIDLAEEASFLFGEDVAKHVASIVDHKIPDQVVYAGIVDEWFIKPFKKYLQLK